MGEKWDQNLKYPLSLLGPYQTLSQCTIGDKEGKERVDGAE